MKIDYKQIGVRVKAVRRRNKMTQAGLAELTDMSASYISSIETGEKQASLGSLIKIAYALNTSLDPLVLDDAFL